LRIILLTVILLSTGQAHAQGQVFAPSRQDNSQCRMIAATVTQRASQGFQVLDRQQRSCDALPVLENAYRTLDTGRVQCGHGWARQLAILETDLLNALDYAGETCTRR